MIGGGSDGWGRGGRGSRSSTPTAHVVFLVVFFSFQKKKCTDSEVRGIIFDTIPPRGQLFCN